RVEPADRLLEADELTPDADLMTDLAAALDEFRLLGTSVKLLPVRLRGVSIVADVRASPRSDLDRVQHDVAHALYVYLNPLIGGSPSGPAEGWPLGRALNLGELFGIVYAIPGVEFVNILRMYETNVRTGEQSPQPTDSRLVLAPDELIASGRHIVKASYRDGRRAHHQFRRRDAGPVSDVHRRWLRHRADRTRRRHRSRSARGVGALLSARQPARDLQ